MLIVQDIVRSLQIKAQILNGIHRNKTFKAAMNFIDPTLKYKYTTFYLKSSGLDNSADPKFSSINIYKHIKVHNSNTL